MRQHASLSRMVSMAPVVLAATLLATTAPAQPAQQGGMPMMEGRQGMMGQGQGMMGGQGAASPMRPGAAPHARRGAGPTGQMGQMGHMNQGGGMMMGGMMRNMMTRMMGNARHGDFTRARPLTAEEAARIIDGRLALKGLSRLRAKDARVKDDKAVEAKIITTGGEFVMRVRVDRMSGRISIIE